jgi:putative membrane protein
VLSLIIRLVVNAIALWIATLIVSGIEIEEASTEDQILTLIVVAAIFAAVNIVVRPVVKLLSLPLYVITLGLFTFVVNALMLMLTSWLAGLLNVPFHVDGFWPAVLGGLVVAFVSWLLNLVLPD